MILDQVRHTVQATVNRAAVLGFSAEILLNRALLVMRDMQRMGHQLIDTGIFRRRDRHNRHAQHRFHRVDVHGAAVFGHLVHHVERDDHREMHFQKLHREVQVALDIRGIDDIHDRVRVLVHDEVARHDLLVRIRRHGVDARQVGDTCIGIPLDGTVLAVHGHAGEIAHMLVRARQPVEQRSLAAVLVAHERKAQHGIVRQGIAVALCMESAVLTESGMLGCLPLLGGRGFGGFRRLDTDPVSIS